MDLSSIKLIVTGIIFKFLKIDCNKYYFISFHGQYSDSPRAISEEIHRRKPNASITWEISEKSKETLPDYIHKVQPRSFKSYYERSVSKVVVDNYLGWLYGYQRPESLKYFILKNLKKKNQINISTWHGTPIKKIGVDLVKSNTNQVFYSTADFLACEDAFLSKLFNRQTQGRLRTIVTGSPKNDILFCNNNELKRKLLIKLGLPLNKRIVLFAPTFRDDVNLSGIQQINDFDFEILLNSLSQRFGGEWIFVFRLHDSVITKLSDNNVLKKENIFSGNNGDNMAEYLALCDVLLTDYTSAIYDFMLTKRPCFLYCPDLDHYENAERGFYVPLNSLPSPIAANFNSLIENINTFDDERFVKECNQFLDFLGNADDGNATQRVLQYIDL